MAATPRATRGDISLAPLALLRWRRYLTRLDDVAGGLTLCESTTIADGLITRGGRDLVTANVLMMPISTASAAMIAAQRTCQTISGTCANGAVGPPLLLVGLA